MPVAQPEATSVQPVPDSDSESKAVAFALPLAVPVAERFNMIENV